MELGDEQRHHDNRGRGVTKLAKRTNQRGGKGRGSNKRGANKVRKKGRNRNKVRARIGAPLESEGE